MTRLQLIIKSLFKRSKILQSIFSQDEIVLQKELEWYSGLISQHFEYFNELSDNNYQECWAECAELFFENPRELNQEYPELYNTIKIILNQDPLNKIKILQPKVVA